MLRTEIDRDEPLKAGDVIEMHFKVFGPNWVWLRASELAVLEWQLRRANPNYKLLKWNTDSAPDKLILTFEILDPVVSVESDPEIQQAGIATIITASILAVAVIGAGFFTWISLDEIYLVVREVVSSPAGQVALVGIGSGGIAILVIAVLLLLRHFQD